MIESTYHLVTQENTVTKNEDRITIRLPSELKAELKKFAIDKRKTLSEWMIECAVEAMQQERNIATASEPQALKPTE